MSGVPGTVGVLVPPTPSTAHVALVLSVGVPAQMVGVQAHRCRAVERVAGFQSVRARPSIQSQHGTYRHTFRDRRTWQTGAVACDSEWPVGPAARRPVAVRHGVRQPRLGLAVSRCTPLRGDAVVLAESATSHGISAVLFGASGPALLRAVPDALTGRLRSSASRARLGHTAQNIGSSRAVRVVIPSEEGRSST